MAPLGSSSPPRDYAEGSDEDYPKRWVTRWRLEPQEPRASNSEPLEPILYHLDRLSPNRNIQAGLLPFASTAFPDEEAGWVRREHQFRDAGPDHAALATGGRASAPKGRSPRCTLFAASGTSRTPKKKPGPTP